MESLNLDELKAYCESEKLSPDCYLVMAIQEIEKLRKENLDLRDQLDDIKWNLQRTLNSW